VSNVEEVGPGELEVQSTITDPRGDAGSVEAQQALQICEAAAAARPDATLIYVLERDGSIFIQRGTATGGACTEV